LQRKPNATKPENAIAKWLSAVAGLRGGYRGPTWNTALRAHASDESVSGPRTGLAKSKCVIPCHHSCVSSGDPTSRGEVRIASIRWVIEDIHSAEDQPLSV
jgi:hypothetical protein